MGILKRAGILIVFVSIIMVISSCGGTSSTSTGGGTSNTGSGYNQGSTPTTAPTAQSTPTTAPATSGNVVVKTAMATVNGKSETILTDAKGMTLYYFTPDTASKTACTAGCIGAWPPLLFTGTGSPQASPKLAGELEIYPNANGKQVIYNDHPLYTFSGDSAAGQTNGEGVAGKWFVATPTIPKNKP